MLNTNAFGDALKAKGYSFYSGVPCSFLSNLINYTINECDYVMAANEGDAVAISSGGALAGKKSVVLMQNSGLTNAVSPLTSLNYTFKLPVLGFVSLRGESGLADEPQHQLMGQVTTQLLDLMQVKWDYLSTDLSEAKSQIEAADHYIEDNQTFFFVVRKSTFDKVNLKEQNINSHVNQTLLTRKDVDEYPSRDNALQVINQKRGDSTVLATTGKTGRELFEVEDAPNNFYMVGSMGCISSLGLGLAKCNKKQDTIIIDGDGSLLMRLGSLATNAYYQPQNLLHILLDNNTHDSTGGQITASSNIDFVQLAASCGYQRAIYIHTLKELEEAIETWKKSKGLTFMQLRIAKGSKKNLSRPSIKPHEVKERIMRFMHD